MTGCDPRYIYKDYGYQAVEEAFEFGHVQLRLKGTDKDVDQYNTTSSSPYTLLIWVSLKTPSEACITTLASLKLVNSRTHTVSYSASDVALSTQVGSAADQKQVYASFQGLDLDYDDHDVELKLAFSPNCFTSHAANTESLQTLKLRLIKHYSEQKRTLWQLISGQ